jgi:hypothetical protein
MYRSYITTINECSNLVMGRKTRYRLLSKAGVSSSPPLPVGFETHPNTKAREIKAISLQARTGGKFVSFCASAALTPQEISLVAISVRG